MRGLAFITCNILIYSTLKYKRISELQTFKEQIFPKFSVYTILFISSLKYTL